MQERDLMAQDNRSETVRVSIDPDLQDLIPGFLQNRRQDIQTLQKAVVVKDFETIRMLGHRMRGDGGGYGFPMISEIGGALEKAALEKHTLDITASVQKLTDYLDRIEIIYE
jgi:HPt (histidine-containing phosphotransfer) domain-containing protein